MWYSRLKDKKLKNYQQLTLNELFLINQTADQAKALSDTFIDNKT